MKAAKTIRSLALAAASCIIVANSAFADEPVGGGETNVASQWRIEQEVISNLNRTFLIEDVPAGVTGWKIMISGNNSAGYSTSYDNRIPNSRIEGEHTNLDFSMLDGSEGSLCKLTGIGGTTFRSTAITSVKLPSTVTTIGQWAFQYCTSLTNGFDFSRITTIGDAAFQGDTSMCGEVVIPALAGALSSKAFCNTRITRVEMPKVTSLGGEVFSGCTELSTIVLPSVTNLGTWAFSGCSSLLSIDLPQVIKVGQGSLNCYNAKNLFLPSLTTLGTQFSRGAGFIRIKFPHCMNEFPVESGYWYSVYNNTNFVHRMSPLSGQDDATIRANGGNIPSYVAIIRYGGAWSNENETVEWYYDDRDTEEYEKSENVTIVAAPALTGSDVQIPKAMTYVDLNEDGTPGETVTKPVTAIEACSFKNNVGLTSVKVPNTVTRIGVAAFPQGCYIKVKNSDHAEALVAQLNAEYGADENGKDYASIYNGGGLILIVR